MTVLRPEWLLALPLVLAFGWWLARRAGGLGDWHKAADPTLLRAMTALGRVEAQGRGSALWAAIGAAVLVILGLAGPAVERRDTVAFRNLDAVIFVLDASPSMTDADSWQQIMTSGRFGIGRLGARPAGLIVFGGDAYVAVDVTRDLRQLGQTFSLIDAETIPDPGSRPERGLELALKLLTEGEVIRGDVILMSDGAGLGPGSFALAERIAERGARLSVLAPGAEGLEAEEMQRLAEQGGGRVFSAMEGTAFAQWLAEEGRAALIREAYPMLYWRDLGRWCLALALLPLLWLFRREAA